jgi:hypothetical protein
MQLPTHVLAGILIQILVLNFIPTPTWLSALIIIIFAFFSHFILDILAEMTYHPAARQPGQFWLIWHVFVYALGVILILIYLNPFWLGIIAANLVDLWDWYILRNYANYRNDPTIGKDYYLHKFKDRFQQKYFSKLPNFRHSKLGILPELIIYCGWFLIVFL